MANKENKGDVRKRKKEGEEKTEEKVIDTRRNKEEERKRKEEEDERRQNLEGNDERKEKQRQENGEKQDRKSEKPGRIDGEAQENGGKKEQKLEKRVRKNGEAREKDEDAIKPSRVYGDDEIHPESYWLTRIVFLRFLAFIYLIAFLVAYNQNKQLIGDTGLLPLQLHMQTILNVTNGSWIGSFMAAPSLFWFAEPWEEVNPWLDNIALAGMTLAGGVLVLGSANVFIMFTLWLLYFSLVSVGQMWYAFGWESQLLETGLLAVWSVPLLSLSPPAPLVPPHPVMVWGLRWLIFRIMLGAGLIKLRGDWCWWNLSCMNYHYETQPVPNPVSYYLHQSPDIIHRLETLGNHFIELVLPFFTFLGRELGMVCGVGQILFQIILIISGNLSFLNWLTIVPSLAYFDDRVYSYLFTASTKNRVKEYQRLTRQESPLVDPGHTRRMVNNAVGTLIAVLSVPVAINLLSSTQMMNTSFEPFRIVNTYGAFGSISKERTEVIFQGTHNRDPKDNSTVWLEYEFKCKPGRVDKQPCLISPYHYRLDWLMWFAAFQTFDQHPWLVHIAGKFLINDEEATSLIEHNPFLGGKPPKFVRAMSYKYTYTHLSNHTKDWYTRKEVGPYLPPVNINTLKLIFRRLKWKTLVDKKQQ